MACIRVSARPESLEFALDKTALIVVDMQNDFGSEGGMFHRAGINIAPIQAIVPSIARVIDAARTAGLPVIYIKMQFAPDMSDVGDSLAPNYIKHQPLKIGDIVTAPDGSPSRILIRGTWNTEIIDELTPRDGDIIVAKSRYSGFFNTNLDDMLKALGIRHLIVTGATTSICVESTVRDAVFRDYQCIVLSDCTAEPIAYDATRSNHEASLLNVELLFGWVTESTRLFDALASYHQAAE
jgi:ureidoacrylate peracid hydrolase